MKTNNRQAGLGLIEVLVAALVFALGIAAVFQLQGKLFQSSSSANARTIAMTLAEERLEIFRQTGAAPDGLANIGDGTDSLTVGNTSFVRGWVVTNYYYDPTDGRLCSPLPLGVDSNGIACAEASGADPKPELMGIRITVNWVEIDGSDSSIVLDGMIGRGTLASAAGILTGDPDGGDGNSPTVPYTPSNDPQVTPIGVGDSTKRETLIPSTDTVDGFARTAFVAHTYKINEPSEVGGDGSVELLRTEEFTTVACDCGFNDLEGAPSYAASHAVWDEAKGSYKDIRGDAIEGKVKGCVQKNGKCVANPDPLCEICCRDHHDGAAVSRKYDPYRSSDGFDFTGNHHHHSSPDAAATTGRYLESCRMKRVDGFWRVYQDWHLIDLTVMPLADLMDTDIRDAYASYVAELVSDYIDAASVDGPAAPLPLAIPSQPRARTGVPAYDAGDQYVELVPGAKSELVARAVYLDYIDPAHLAEVKKLKSDEKDFLLHVPFYEVDITPIVAWSSDVPAALQVGPYDDSGNVNDLIAGELDALGTNPEAIPITGEVRQSNSGLVALSQAVDFLASFNPDDQTVPREVHVCVGCTAGVDPTSCKLPWGGAIADLGFVTAYQYKFASSDEQCGISETRTCTSGNLSGTYQYKDCTVGTPPPPPPATCETTVTGTNNKDDTISVAVFDEAGTLVVEGPWACNVKTQKYTCNPVNSFVDATIKVTRTNSSGVNETIGLSENCGSQTVNFK